MSTDAGLPRASVLKAPAEDPEAVWLREVYRPHEPNLTVRAAIVGALIGGIMCLSNLYVFFKTGWSMGVTLTACILGFVVFEMTQAVGLTKRPLGVLENNALTTVASGAGYMTGGGNMAAYGALVMVIATTPQLAITEPSAAPMIAWFALIAALGVFVAIPIKRQLINKEALAFPTGTATAETIESIHAAAAAAGTANRPTGTSKAAWLGYASLFGAVVALLRDGLKVLPGVVPLPIQFAGHELAKWTIALKTEVVLLGAGALMSFRTGWSLLLGGLLTYAVMAPELLARGLISLNAKGEISYKAIVGWTLWPGAAILVGAGLTSFFLDWRSLARSFQGLGAIFGKSKQTGPAEGIAAVESPEWWFPAALIGLGPLIVILMSVLFHIPVWAAVIAVPLAVVMGFIASRVTGETDVTPTKALGPVTQMLYGVITPGNMTGNIMSANVTGGIGLHSADLLTTLKTGWLLGARPRHQLYAQLIGVVVGAAIVVPAFMLIIPDPTPEQLAAGIKTVLGTEEWPAPSCLVWAGVSEAFTNGIGNMHSSTRIAIGVGLALGVALTIFEKVAPKGVRAYIPSANGLGIAMVIPASNCIAMFLGASVAELLRRRQQDGAVIPVASGLIAGESLMGIVIVVLTSIVGLNLAL
ncbi:MAG: OPT/YSL family transporter [Deltaproteobacteria bacterium]|nr:OPT/YSL family transporter [Deltaproteobacteria bacterium]